MFPGQIFRYPRGDAAGRAEAQAYGRQLANPEPQLDWTVCARSLSSYSTRGGTSHMGVTFVSLPILIDNAAAYKS